MDGCTGSGESGGLAEEGGRCCPLAPGACWRSQFCEGGGREGGGRGGGREGEDMKEERKNRGKEGRWVHVLYM